NLVPNKIGLVGKAPRLHYGKAVWKKRIWTPQIQVSSIPSKILDRQRSNIVERHRGITHQPMMLRRNFSCLVLKSPRRICEHRRSPSSTHCSAQFTSDAHRKLQACYARSKPACVNRSKSCPFIQDTNSMSSSLY